MVAPVHSGVLRPYVRRRPMQDQQAAHAKDPVGRDRTHWIVNFVHIDEDEIVSRVRQARQDLPGVAGDQPGPGRAETGGGEGLPRHRVMVGLGVDGGQYGIGRQPLQKPQSAYAEAGADLDDVANSATSGQAPQ